MFKIRSRFYVIYGDSVPIYVGFTSKTVRQRFSEHIKSKDFSDFDEVRVVELKEDELDFDFCWDYDIIGSEADKVSQKEAELVKKFGTQDSEFQKANGGGVVWTHIKYFVLSNKNNPKYRGMSGTEIHEYLENRKKEMDILRSFIGRVCEPSKIILSSFAGRIYEPSKGILHSFIRCVNYPSRILLDGFARGIKYPSKAILCNFTRGVKYPSESILSDFTGYVGYPSQGILYNFTRSVNYPSGVMLRSFTCGIDHPSKIILKNFTRCMKTKKEK